MDKESYWFFLEPYMHISVKQNCLLLYNTLNGKVLQYNNDEIIKLVKKLISEKKLFVIKLSYKELQSFEIANFVNQVRKYYMGDIVNCSYSKIKPIQLMPILSIQSEGPATTYFGEEIMKSLTEISFYINNNSNQNSRIFSNGFKQFLFCNNNHNKYNELILEEIIFFISESKGSMLSQVNILGGNIFTYSKFSELISNLNNLQAIKSYYIYYLDLKDCEKKLDLIRNKNSEINILISCPVNEYELSLVIKNIKRIKIKTIFTFIIEKEKHIEKIEKIISKLGIEQYSLQPYYNSKNLTFFKNNVFITKKELLQSKIKQKDIHARMAINPFQFGKLTVLSNGNIHANVNAPKLGKIGENSLYDIIYKEMTRGKSWRRLRMKVKPCRSCVFNLLCPPLSNYEYALGRNNLCNIWEKNNKLIK